MSRVSSMEHPLGGVSSEQLLVARRVVSSKLTQVCGGIAALENKPAGLHISVPSESPEPGMYLAVVEEDQLVQSRLQGVDLSFVADAGNQAALKDQVPSLRQSQRVAATAILEREAKRSGGWLFLLRLTESDHLAARDERRKTREALMEIGGLEPVRFGRMLHEPAILLARTEANLPKAFVEGLSSIFQKHLGLPLWPSETQARLPLVLGPAEYPLRVMQPEPPSNQRPL